MKSPKINIILIIIISIAAGLLSGFFGSLLFLAVRTVNIPFIGKLEKYLPQREITIQTQEKITVQRDAILEDSLKKTKGQIVRIFIAKPNLEDKIKENKSLSDNLINQVYLEKEVLGLGFILTHDGWIVSSKSVVNQFQNNYLILTDNNKFYPVQKIVEDTFTGVIFLKVFASNLPVVNLLDKEDIILGQEVLAFDKNNDLFVSYLNQINNCPKEKKEDLIRNTEEFCEFLKVDGNLNGNFKGSALINLSQGVIGLIGDKGIVPSYYFKNLLNQVFKTEKIERPVLGIDFIDLSSVALAEENSMKALGDRGVLIYRVVKNSPAQKAGLLKDDIILKINNDSINGQLGLTELIQDYNKGDTLKLTIIRDGKEKVIELKL